MITETVTTPVPAIVRMQDILSLLANQSKALSLAEICKILHLPRSSTQRLLNTLEQYQFVYRHSKKYLYTLGMRCAILHSQFIANASKDNLLHIILENLAQKLQETVKISQVIDREVAVIYHAEPSDEYHIVIPARVRFPLHAGAASKLLLALGDEALRKKIIASPLTSYTQYTISDGKLLSAELKKISAEKISYDRGEYNEEIAAVALPIYYRHENIYLALSVPFINMPTKHKKIESLLPLLRQSVKEIELIINKE